MFTNRMEIAYTVSPLSLFNRMEIAYTVVADDTGVRLSGTSTTETAGIGIILAPQPVPLDGVSVAVADGDGVLSVVVYLSGTSTTMTAAQGRLTWRPHFSGVGETLTLGEGRISVLLDLSGWSTTLAVGQGRAVIPVDIAGISITETAGSGDMIAPRPVPIEGPWITLTTGSGTLLVFANLRGPSLTRTTGRGRLHLEDTTGEFVEAEHLVMRLPDTYNKTRGSRITRFFRVVGAEFAEIRRALTTTERMRDIDQATGATLDGIGRNVRQPRGQLSDRAYRTVIKAAIARHLSPGTVDAIKQIVAAMLDVPVTEINVRQMWTADPPEPAAVLITAPIGALAEFDLTPAQFAVLMQRIVAAGVRVSSLVGGTFQLSEDLVIDPERGLADDEMTVGGTLSAYFDMGDEAELPLEG